jgi:hypothetical protein
MLFFKTIKENSFASAKNMQHLFEWAQKHPTQFMLLLGINSLPLVHSCFMVYCQYVDLSNPKFGGSMIVPNLPELPSNLTDYCKQNNASKDDYFVNNTSSMDTFDDCNYAVVYKPF